jgi:hypothetical protein
MQRELMSLNVLRKIDPNVLSYTWIPLTRRVYITITSYFELFSSSVWSRHQQWVRLHVNRTQGPQIGVRLAEQP